MAPLPLEMIATDDDAHDATRRAPRAIGSGFDEHRADVRSFGGNGHYHREYGYHG